MRMFIVAVAIALVSDARADVLTFGRMDGLSVARQHVEGAAAGPILVRLELAAGGDDVRDRSLVLRSPRDLTITSLTLDNGSQHLTARLVEASGGRDVYRRILAAARFRPRDPALLEWMTSTESSDHFLLRVFPVIAGQSARVELVLQRAGDGVSARRSLLALDDRSRFPQQVTASLSYEDRFPSGCSPSLLGETSSRTAQDIALGKRRVSWSPQSRRR